MEEKTRELQVELTTQLRASNKKIYETSEELRECRSDYEYEKNLFKIDISELKESLDDMRIKRNDSVECLENLQSEIMDLRKENKLLKEANEELMVRAVLIYFYNFIL